MRASTKKPASFEKRIERAARCWGNANGYEGAVGGWIYRYGYTHPVTQGWSSFARAKAGRIACAIRDRELRVDADVARWFWVGWSPWQAERAEG